MAFPVGWTRRSIPSAISNPSSSVDDFVYFVSLDQMDAAWWAAVKSDGGDVRASKGDGITQLPVDLIEWNYGSNSGLLAVRYSGTQGTTADDIQIWCGNGSATADGPTDTYGSENVYDSSHVCVYPSGGGNDRTGNDNDLTMSGSPTVGGASGPIDGMTATSFDGSTQYGTANAVVPSSESPLSFFSLVKTGTLPATAPYPNTCYLPTICFRDSATTAESSNIHGIGLDKDGAAWDWTHFVEAAFAQAGPASSSTWYAIGGRSVSSTSRFVYVDGTEGAEDTTSRTGSCNTISVALGVNASPARLLPCDLSLLIGWNTAKSAAYIQYLSSMLDVTDADQSAFFGTWTSESVAVNVPPAIDLNGAGGGLDVSITFTKGDSATTICGSATVVDDDAEPLLSASIVAAGYTDAESLFFGSSPTEFALDTNLTDTVTEGTTTFQIAYTTSTGVFAITKNGGGTFPTADYQTLIRTITYENTSTADIIPGDRTLTFTASDDEDEGDPAVATITVVSPRSEGDRTISISGTNTGGTGTSAVCTISVNGNGAPLLARRGDFSVGRTQIVSAISITNNGGAGTFAISSDSETSSVELTAIGLTLNTSNGTLSGTISGSAVTGEHPIKIECSNANGTSYVEYSLFVATNLIEVSTADSFPYYCSQDDTCYVCTEAVSSEGTLFFVVADNVLLNLGGFEHNYDNATPISIVNPSFETGTGAAATGWDFANAPNAERWAGTWLLSEVYDGSYSLKFSDTTGDEYVENTTNVVLEAGVKYSLTAMIDWAGEGNPSNPGVQCYVRLTGTGSEPTVELLKTGGNNRGIQWYEEEFTTPGTGTPTYVLTVGITGEPTSAYPMYVDDIKIQKSRVKGIAVGPTGSSSSYFGDLDVGQAGAASGTIICNGALTQGSDGGVWSHGIHIRYGVVCSGVDITVNGANCSTIWQLSSANLYSKLSDCILTSNCITADSRDDNDGSNVYRIAGEIHHNTVVGSPSCGIVIGGSEFGYRTNCYNNHITIQGKYTNSFGIRSGWASQVYNNTIVATGGSNEGRGIFVPFGGNVSEICRVFNNTISAQALRNNQEYGGSGGGGIVSGGCYGIQIETGEYTEIYGNTVTVNGSDTEAACLRLTNQSSNLSIHNNTFTAITESGIAAAFSFYISYDMSDVKIEDNIINIDKYIARDVRDISNCVIKRTHIIAPTLTSSPMVLQKGVRTESGGIHAIVQFLDTTFEDAASETNFDAMEVYDNNDNPTTYVQFDKSWTTTIHVTDSLAADANGATVVIDDATVTEVINDVTDTAGELVVVLNEFSVVGDTKTALTPHSVDVTYGIETDSDTITADQIQTVELQTA